MKIHHTILLSQITNRNSLVTREAATSLMDKIKERSDYYVEVDFSGINFISRSFADQFHKEKLLLWEVYKTNVVVINAHDDVLSMLQAVSKTQYDTNRQFDNYPIVHFTTRRSLKSYLYAL